ncbi:MAG: GNAT family N-acetyltransferase [Proteobacteria bacterium]|nr:GNAT family N-acetyltransferase [Pseudomonadota bacterium]
MAIPKGPVAANAEAMNEGLANLLTYCRANKLVELSINPQVVTDDVDDFDLPLSAGGWRRVDRVESQSTLRLDVTQSIDTMFANLSKSTRREIRRAERAGIHVRVAKSKDDFKSFFEIYSARGQLRNFQFLPRTNFIELANRLLSMNDRGGLFLSELGGVLLGGVLVLRAGLCAHYVYGASAVERAPSLPISHPALWRAICWSKDIGCTEFDFGGGGGAAGIDGIMHFKRGFGGKPVGFIPPLQYELRPALSRFRNVIRAGAH